MEVHRRDCIPSIVAVAYDTRPSSEEEAVAIVVAIAPVLVGDSCDKLASGVLLVGSAVANIGCDTIDNTADRLWGLPQKNCHAYERRPFAFLVWPVLHLCNFCSSDSNGNPTIYGWRSCARCTSRHACFLPFSLVCVFVFGSSFSVLLSILPYFSTPLRRQRDVVVLA